MRSREGLAAAPRWALGVAQFLHQLLSVVGTTAFAPVKLAKARGEATPGKLGVRQV